MAVDLYEYLMVMKITLSSKSSLSRTHYHVYLIKRFNSLIYFTMRENFFATNVS